MFACSFGFEPLCQEERRIQQSDRGGSESPRLSAAIEIGLIVLLFSAIAWSTPPDVNEAHYLAKARHHWQPGWCAGDFFLEASSAHGTFFTIFGGLTTLVSLPTAAWVGRALAWSLLGWTWYRLSNAFLPRTGMAFLSAALLAMFLEWGHMAGEWVLGGVESKVFAYVLVFLGLESLVRGLWSRVWLYLGAAASLHVLVGGWSVVAALAAWLLSSGARPPWWRMLPPLAGGLLLSLPGLLPALSMNGGVDPDTVQAANRIYVFQRLSHHLVFHRLPTAFVVRHVALIIALAVIVSRCRWQERQRRLLRFGAAAVGIAAVGVAIDLATRQQPVLAASLLRFYWFRLADVMVPLCAALVWVACGDQLRRRAPGRARLVLAAAAVIAAASGGHSLIQAISDPRPPAIVQGSPRRETRAAARQRYDQWRRACEWIATHSEAGAIVLTPKNQQTMKWYGQRAEVVNWKDIPQDAAGIVQWWRRLQQIYPPETAWRGLVHHGEARLVELADQYDFHYVLLDRSRSKRPLTFPRVYPASTEDSLYEVYRVPP